MPAFLSDEWFGAVLDAASALEPVDGLGFDFDIEVAESEFGKVRGHGRVDDGRLVTFELGKATDPVDVSFIAKAKRAIPIVRGEVPPLVAYMVGELKIDGAYELVVDRLANEANAAALSAFGGAVAAATD